MQVYEISLYVTMMEIAKTTSKKIAVQMVDF